MPLTEKEKNKRLRERNLSKYIKPRHIKDEYYIKGIDKIGYFDVEVSHLKANMGILFTWSMVIRDVQSGRIKVYYDHIDRADVLQGMKDRNPDIDKEVVKSAIDTMKECQLIIGHYAIGPKKLDLPFLRARAAYSKIEFPNYQRFRFLDTWGKGRTLYALTSNRLGSFGDMFGVPEHKTTIDWNTWRLAQWGDKKALAYIVKHNIADVKITYKVHKGMENLLPIPGTYF